MIWKSLEVMLFILFIRLLIRDVGFVAERGPATRGLGIEYAFRVFSIFLYEYIIIEDHIWYKREVAVRCRTRWRNDGTRKVPERNGRNDIAEFHPEVSHSFGIRWNSQSGGLLSSSRFESWLFDLLNTAGFAKSSVTYIKPVNYRLLPELLSARKNNSVIILVCCAKNQD